MASVYVVDTSSLFELKRFPPEVFPSLWANLDPFVATGRLIAPREVLREVERGDDEMNSWARAHHAMFLDLDPATAACLEEVFERFEALRDTRSLPIRWWSHSASRDHAPIETQSSGRHGRTAPRNWCAQDPQSLPTLRPDCDPDHGNVPPRGLPVLTGSRARTRRTRSCLTLRPWGACGAIGHGEASA